MDQRLSVVTLGVVDLRRARRFYEALGWAGGVQPDDEVCFFQAGGLVVSLWTALGSRGGAPGVELALNVAAPDDVDAVLAEARAAGAVEVRPGGATEWGGYAGAFADPDGYVWEIAHNPFWTLHPDGRVTLDPPTAAPPVT
jgi:predicted lactoylglutathione lyase